MSAFILCDQHITAMLKAARLCSPGGGRSYYWNGESHAILSNMHEIGQKLVDENYRSVNYRYEREEAPREFMLRATEHHEPIHLVTACDCYIYQSCEHPGWEKSEAYAIVQVLRNMAIQAVPGYGEVWEITS